MRTLVHLATPDGSCPVHVHRPAGDEPLPGVIMYMDAPGIRPALHELAARLAEQGYHVLLPDLFYRSGAYDPVDPRRVWADQALRAQHRARFMALATPAAIMADTVVLLDFLQSDPAVAAGRVGVVGYCMGGRLALIAAGTFPDRVAVAASCHAGGLANDTASSPHLLASRMMARVYVAGAIDDSNFPEDMKVRLGDALSGAGVDHAIETYPAKHGWVPRDTPAHDAVEAEHHWRTLVPLFDDVLKA